MNLDNLEKLGINKDRVENLLSAKPVTFAEDPEEYQANLEYKIEMEIRDFLFYKLQFSFKQMSKAYFRQCKARILKTILSYSRKLRKIGKPLEDKKLLGYIKIILNEQGPDPDNFWNELFREYLEGPEEKKKNFIDNVDSEKLIASTFKTLTEYLKKNKALGKNKGFG